MSLITDWVLSPWQAAHQFEDGLYLQSGPHQCGGQHTGYGVLQVCYVHSAACTSVLRVLSD